MTEILSKVENPSCLKSLTLPELSQLAEEIRKEIIFTVSSNGGHLASNLGIVEITIALHRIFDAPHDKIVWDVGHQCYPHKLLTGRCKQFHTIRQYGGISGFPRPSESPYDTFGAGHSSTSISAALGLAIQRDLRGSDEKIVAVIGDGALTSGMALEAMNHLGYLGTDVIVVLNDNEKSISKNVGAYSVHLSKLRMEIAYRKTKQSVKSFLRTRSLPNSSSSKLLTQLRKRLKRTLTPSRTGAVFQELGFIYLGPIDGHDIELLMETFESAKELNGPILIHAATKKGKGYEHAENDSTKFHGVSPFNLVNGKVQKKSNIPSYSEVFGRTLIDIAKKDEKIVAITAAMADGTGLRTFGEEFPNRFFDVGIAEQHAVTLAAGLAMAGAKPVAAIYSTFLQRGYDQVVHDVCLQNLPVTFMLDRGGIVGNDGPTHNGVFDFAYLRHIPNIVLMAPKDENELRHMLKTAIDFQGPTAVRYPRGAGIGVRIDNELRNIPIGKSEILREGDDVAIFAIGSMVYPSLKAAEILAKSGIQSTVVNSMFIKPLDKTLILKLASKIDAFITVEEHALAGGFGSTLLELLADDGVRDIKVARIGLPDTFIEHGSRSILLREYGLTAENIAIVARNFIKKERYSKAAQGSRVEVAHG